MKTTVLFEELAKIAEPYLNEMKYLCTFSPDEKHIRYGIDSNKKGLYVFYAEGDTTQAIYLGETVSCVKTRIRCHKHSLMDPDWKVEVTGKKFKARDINRIQKFDVYFIEYDDAVTRYDSRTIEGILKLVLQPLVFN